MVRPESQPPGFARKAEADLGAWRDDPPPEPGWLDRVSDPVWSVSRGADGSLSFVTDFPGRPHVVAATWYPDWRADGAEGPYPLSSGQMVVYPSARSVTLRHATLPSELAGRLLSLCGLLALAALLVLHARPRRDSSRKLTRACGFAGRGGVSTPPRPHRASARGFAARIKTVD